MLDSLTYYLYTQYEIYIHRRIHKSFFFKYKLILENRMKCRRRWQQLWAIYFAITPRAELLSYLMSPVYNDSIRSIDFTCIHICICIYIEYVAIQHSKKRFKQNYKNFCRSYEITFNCNYEDNYYVINVLTAFVFLWNIR